jgi:hypothetical protein
LPAPKRTEAGRDSLVNIGHLSGVAVFRTPAEWTLVGTQPDLELALESLAQKLAPASDQVVTELRLRGLQARDKPQIEALLESGVQDVRPDSRRDYVADVTLASPGWTMAQVDAFNKRLVHSGNPNSKQPVLALVLPMPPRFAESQMARWLVPYASAQDVERLLRKAESTKVCVFSGKRSEKNLVVTGPQSDVEHAVNQLVLETRRLASGALAGAAMPAKPRGDAELAPPPMDTIQVSMAHMATFGDSVLLHALLQHTGAAVRYQKSKSSPNLLLTIAGPDEARAKAKTIIAVCCRPASARSA